MKGPVHVGKLDHTQRHVVLSVADTGCGMSAELISRIFMSYVSTKGDKGTGLGLSIVASVVATNGGAIKVSSEPGCGTHFVILWPVDGPRAAPVPLSSDSLTGRLDGVKILVTVDQQEVLDVLTALLEAAGAEVAPSTEPADILAAVEADPNAWGLVLTDRDMPGIGGEALVHAVRDFAPSLPVILITARAEITRWHLPIFDTILSKPVDREKLILAVEAAMIARS